MTDYRISTNPGSPRRNDLASQAGVKNGSEQTKFYKADLSIEDVFTHVPGNVGSYLYGNFPYESMSQLQFVSHTAAAEYHEGVKQAVNDFLENNAFNIVNAYKDETFSIKNVLLNTDLSNEKKKFIISGLFLLNFDNNITQLFENNVQKDIVKRDIAIALFKNNLELLNKAFEIAKLIKDSKVGDKVKIYIAIMLFKNNPDLLKKVFKIVESIEDNYQKDIVKRDIAIALFKSNLEFALGIAESIKDSKKGDCVKIYIAITLFKKNPDLRNKALGTVESIVDYALQLSTRQYIDQSV